MKVGDVVLDKNYDDPSTLAWVGVVKRIDGKFVECVTMCVSSESNEMRSVELDHSCTEDDLIVLGNLSQAWSGEPRPVEEEVA